MTDAGPQGRLQPRALVTVREFCRQAELDEDSVASLIESEKLPGLLDSEGRGFGFFEDELPSPRDLRALGLAPASTFDAQKLRGFYRESSIDEPGP
jgi:hypothetical protein